MQKGLVILALLLAAVFGLARLETRRPKKTLEAVVASARKHKAAKAKAEASEVEPSKDVARTTTKDRGPATAVPRPVLSPRFMQTASSRSNGVAETAACTLGPCFQCRSQGVLLMAQGKTREYQEVCDACRLQCR